MAGRKLNEIDFILNAQMNSGFHGTFTKASGRAQLLFLPGQGVLGVFDPLFQLELFPAEGCAALHEIGGAYLDCITIAGDFQASMSTVEALSGAFPG